MSVYIRDMHTNQLTGPEVSSVPPAAPPATAVEATARELIEILCVDIKIGERYRRDMGDLEALAASIKAEGLLQPIGVTEDRALVFGERRLRAVQDILNRDTITARVVRVSSIVAGEYAENEVRKDFTPSERAAIAKAIEDQIPERRGGTNPEKFPDWKGKETREIVAEKAASATRRLMSRPERWSRKARRSWWLPWTPKRFPSAPRPSWLSFLRRSSALLSPAARKRRRPERRLTEKQRRPSVHPKSRQRSHHALIWLQQNRRLTPTVQWRHWSRGRGCGNITGSASKN